MDTGIFGSHGWLDRFRIHREPGRRVVHGILAPAGIEINGTRPFDVQVLDSAFYDATLRGGISGALDAYVNGWWETDRLDELTHRLVSCGIVAPASRGLGRWVGKLSARLLNRQSRRRSLGIRRHYDLRNDLFEAMLDGRMVYSCGYWREASDLDAAQEAKLALVCRKIGLRSGMRVLDIGCGWGSFAKYAAQMHGASVVGITLSRNQCEYGKDLCAGLPVELRLQDYRALDDEPFDAVVSIGMFEHVGYKNYRRYMEIARRCLKPGGLFLLQTIGGRASSVSIHPWIHRNIFPNAVLPSAAQIATAAEGLMIIEDWQNFGPDYDRTLMAWFANFDARWPILRRTYGDRFYRMWKCYLLTCAGEFRAREKQLWQIVLSPSGVRGGYRALC